MKQWVRGIPTPNYGYWCGAKNTHEKWSLAHPIDEGDSACRVHDFALREASWDKDPAIRKEARKKADEALYQAWKAWRPVKIWSRIYRAGILMVFKPRK